MKSRAILLLASVVAAACSGVQPMRITAGDVCTRCRKVISEPRIAAELIDTAGHAFKFRTSGCMAKYLKANPAEQSSHLFATDYATSRLVKISSVQFVPTMFGDRRDQPDYVAFYAEKGAADAAQREHSTPVDWPQVLADATPQ